MKRAGAICALACIALATQAPALAGDGTASTSDSKTVVTPPVPDNPFGSKIHLFVQNEFSDRYLTPRGLLVENEGLVWQPLAILMFDVYSADSGFLTDATIAPGNWASIHSHRDGPELKKLERR